jgi:N,N'-diacetyllegionaminate synthase
MIFEVLENKKPLIIAEVAQAHDGSLGNAHAFIDAAARAGADAIKFQTHIASAESTFEEPWRVPFSKQDRLRYDYWKRMEFTEDQWQGLFNHASERGMIFLSSPFSIEAIELLMKIGVKTWKVASGELYNPELLEGIWKTRYPILFSSGMSSFSELKKVVAKTQELKISFGIFQCTTEYPCKPEHWGLNVISELKKEFKCPIGLSDHSGSIYAGLAAAALGADFIEVHVTYSKEMFGPDTLASITFDELKILVEGSKEINKAISNPIDKDGFSEKMSSMKKIFSRSVGVKEDLEKGTILKKEHLTLKKPGSGIKPEEIDIIVGKKLNADKRKENLLRWEDFES